MLDSFGSLGIDNRPRRTFALFLLASPPNAASGKQNVMQNCDAIRLFTAVACYCKGMISWQHKNVRQKFRLTKSLKIVVLTQ